MAFKIRSKYIQRITIKERKFQIKGKYVVIYVYSVERKVISSQVFTSSFEYHTNMSMCVLSQFINLPSFCHKAYTNIHKEPTSINVSYSSTSYAVMCSHCNQPNLSVLVLFKTKAAGIFKDTFKRVNFKCVILEKCKISGNSGGMETVG